MTKNILQPLWKYAKNFVCLLLIAMWCAMLAFFMYKIGPKGVKADFFRSWIIFFLLAAAMLFMAASWRRGIKILSWAYAFTLSLIGALVALAYHYFKTTNSRLTIDHVYATLQSDIAESIDYSLTNIFTYKPLALSALVFLSGIVVLGATGLLFKNEIRSIRPNWLIIALPATFAAVAVILCTQISPVKSTYFAYHSYYEDLNTFNKLFNDLNTKNMHRDAVKEESGELYVMVIGEAQSRDFMHYYTGPAENTPWMDACGKAKDLIVYRNAYSCHTHTVPVLSMALTTGRNLTSLTYPAGQNLLTLSKHAGIHTVWLSNQAPLGPWDSPVSAIAHLADTVRFSGLHQSTNLAGLPPDEILLPMLDEEIQGIDFSRNTLLVIHLMGSHAPYPARVPKNFPGMNIASAKDIGALSVSDDLGAYNDYINSIRYTDDLLRKIHSRLEAYADKPVFMIYFADHGEDIFVSGGGHNFSNFTWTMARIPMFIWTSPGYAQRYPDKVKQLRLHSDKIFTNDLIYDLYAGLANIQTKDYMAEYDISDARYSLSLDNAVMAGGRVDSDPHWNIRRNAKNPKFALHRSNTIFKTRQGQRLGIGNFEMDLVYTEDSGQPDLMVGYDAEVMAGMNLAEYLAELNSGIDWLWMDCKNLNKKNCQQFYDILSGLDAKYNLRPKALIETGNPAAAHIFNLNGWNTSYYLPWEELLNAAKTSPEDIAHMAEDIAATVREYGIGGVSYDLKADAVVSAHLAALLPPGTKRYAWTTKWGYEDKDLAEKMRDYPYLSRLLVGYKTPFHL